MKMILLADLHFGAGSNNRLMLESQKKFFENQLFPAIKQKPTCVKVLGDFFHSRSNIDVAILNEAYQFLSWFEENEIPIDIILGNHDIYYRHSRKVNSVTPLAEDFKYVRIIDVPTVDMMGTTKIFMVPWITKNDKGMKFEEADLCLGHFEFKGFEMTKGFRNEHGFEPKTLKRYDHVYSGHFHGYQTQGNVTYVGAPYQLNWGDSGVPKYFVSWENGKGTTIENNQSLKFVKLIYDKGFNKGEVVALNNDHVRVYVSSSEPKAFEADIKALESRDGLLSVEVANAPLMGSDAVLSPEEAKKTTGELLVDYLEEYPAFPAELNKPACKSMLRKMYVEALDRMGIEDEGVTNSGHLEFVSISIRNFKSFGNKPTVFNFENGELIRIHGTNGAGKSAIIDSLYFGLYGKSMHGVKLGELVNDVNRKDCEIKVIFKKNGKLYEVVRGIWPSHLKIFENGKPVEQKASKAKDQELLTEIIGMERWTFRNVVILSEDMSQYFMELSAAAQRGMVEELMQVRVFSFMLWILKEYESEVKSIIEKTEIQLNADEARHSTELQSIQSRKVMAQTLRNKKAKQLITLGGELQEIRLGLDHGKTSHDILVEEFGKLDIAEIEKARAKAESDFDTVDDRIRQLDQALAGRKARAEERDKAVARFKKQIENASNKSCNLEDEMLLFTTTLSNSKRECEDLENTSNITEWIKSLACQIEDELRPDLTQIDIKIAKCEAAKELVDAGKCPTCGQDTEVEHLTDEAGILIEAEEQKATCLKMLEEASQAIADHRAEIQRINSLNDELEKNEAHMLSLEADHKSANKDYDNLKYELEGLESAVEVSIGDLEEKRKEYSWKYESHEMERGSKRDEEKGFHEKKRKVEESNKERARMQERATRVEAEIVEIQAEPDPENVDGSELRRLKEIIVTSKKTLGAAKKQLVYFEFIKKKVLADDGIKAHIVDAYLPYVNYQVTKYLEEFGLPVGFEFDSTFTPKLIGRYQNERTYLSFSAGQRNRINLSIAMAFCDLARHKATIFSNVLFMDEVLDSHLDADGRAAALEVILRKAKNENMSIYVISHHEQSVEGFTKEYEVTSVGGFSQLNLA